MKSKKRYTLTRSNHRQKSFLSLDFLKTKKTALHGATLGLILVVVGWLVVSLVILVIGAAIFVPSFGAMVLKFFKSKVARV